jgi:hypothetical protein
VRVAPPTAYHAPNQVDIEHHAERVVLCIPTGQRRLASTRRSVEQNETGDDQSVAEDNSAPPATGATGPLNDWLRARPAQRSVRWTLSTDGPVRRRVHKSEPKEAGVLRIEQLSLGAVAAQLNLTRRRTTTLESLQCHRPNIAQR